jgi:chromosomal replication initiation ATPase DnaA
MRCQVPQRGDADSESERSMNAQVFDELLSNVAEAFALPPEEVLTNSRVVELVEARWVIAYVLRTNRRMSLPAIGRRLGRDHTTVMHGLREIEKRPDLVSLAGMFMRPAREVA